MAGGVVRQSDGGIVGEAAVDFIAQFKVDYAVIGASAIDEDGAMLDFDYREVRVAKAIMSNARNIILVADAMKFTRSAPVRIGHLSQVDVFVTDQPPPEPIVELCQRATACSSKSPIDRPDNDNRNGCTPNDLRSLHHRRRRQRLRHRARCRGPRPQVFLAEQNDLASGTSSASTKLIHGGLRYLEHYEFRLVREALIEREVLLNAAPHIIWPLRFVLPHHEGLRPADAAARPVPLRPSRRPQDPAGHAQRRPAHRCRPASR